MENKDLFLTEIAAIFRRAYWFARQHPKQKNTLNIGKLTKQQADLVLSKVLKAGYLPVQPVQYPRCPHWSAVDGKYSCNKQLNKGGR